MNTESSHNKTQIALASTCFLLAVGLFAYAYLENRGIQPLTLVQRYEYQIKSIKSDLKGIQDETFDFSYELEKLDEGKEALAKLANQIEKHDLLEEDEIEWIEEGLKAWRLRFHQLIQALRERIEAIQQRAENAIETKSPEGYLPASSPQGSMKILNEEDFSRLPKSNQT